MNSHVRGFPDLPTREFWSAEITQAHQLIQGTYQQALQVLQQGDDDAIRLQIHADQLKCRVELLEALEHVVDDTEWIEKCSHCLGRLIRDLQHVASAAEGHDVSSTNIVFLNPVHLASPGGRGRPSFVFDREWLAEAVSTSRCIPLQTLARNVGVHRNTLRHHLRTLGLSKQFSDIRDEELDEIVRYYKQDRPHSGLRFVIAYLKSHGVHVQRERIRQSLQRVDPLGRILRRRTTVQRRVYEVPRANYLWHIDGHHKLIRWGFVIHGMIDGYSRTVVGLRASTDNRASTVLDLFIDATATYGTPSRVRGDRGGENMEVAIWMILHRGPDRGSFMWGKSTQNSRIERLWVDVGVQFLRCWRAFFRRLEGIHSLHPTDSRHLWLLQYLFLDQLNEDCRQFQNDWNHHPISKHGHNQSPLDMRFLSELQHGVYVECHGNIHPDVGARYAGDGQAADDVQAEIEVDQDRHVRHAAIAVPPAATPFLSAEARESFILALQVIRNEHLIPMGYGVAQEEWADGSYPELEVIAVGRKDVEIKMPFAVWWPRAVLWAQGLDVMMRVCMFEAGEI